MAGEEGFCRLTCARAGLTQDELLIGQRTRRHAAVAGQRMVGGGDHHQRVGEKGRGDHRRRQRWAAHDVEVVEVVCQPAQHGVAVQYHQRHFHRRTFAPELAQQAGDEGLRGADHGQAQAPADVAAQLGKRLVEQLELLLQPRCACHHDLARRCQMQAAADALEQWQADLFGELAQLGRQRGLGEVQALGGARDAALAGDGE
ncbi:hypothetical protein M622_00845 [Thauera terpenica 58Eu]|uniref:Uncharacterized protein n=1 Tax=Thauera terpenica 58Eu TaxID=1348657 RepID=S9ZIY0_9RHOO|nr:hypothetical protein M622_00845 [Thauera terpenica 58Eu]